ncbi:uncharacterized protein N7511_002041 [Penicillium nucicola]|uniref:uncharacterized protein n=1 Tax=Penicillium nucicola TaxID=1850975 RepID=UPI0025459A72|nr:uncharacterized protein N7511_002041 [Penicillium nucicola]KAJ5769990.1 hypothetical protein N7511_002041 [Penicillium nucicola]
MVERFDALTQTEGWANARDVGTLTKTIFEKTIERSGGREMQLSQTTMLEAIDSMILERTRRANVLKKTST